MMEKAIKQRLLGGLVLVAGAALFLPVLLDGSGAGLTIPPLPAAPEVAGVEAMAPQLEQKVAEAEQAVDAAHAGREEAEAPVAEGDVVADAAALAAEEGAAATATANAAAAAASKAPVTATAARPVPPSVPALARPAGSAPSVSAKPVAVAPAPAKPLATGPVPVKPAPTAPKPASAAVPGAWIVQVASLSSREQAQKLVQQLRAKGYPAVLNPQGEKWKVMVGPELNRAVADSIKNRLAADPELKLNGWVQAYKP